MFSWLVFVSLQARLSMLKGTQMAKVMTEPLPVTKWPLGAVSLKEAMSLLGGITRPTLAALIKSGEVRRGWVASKPVICKQSILEYLARQED